MFQVDIQSIFRMGLLCFLIFESSSVMGSYMDFDQLSSCSNFLGTFTLVGEQEQQESDDDEIQYAKAIKHLEKLETLYVFDPHILDNNNDTIPDFSNADSTFLRGVLGFYSDDLQARENVIYRSIIEPLINCLETLADFSISRANKDLSTKSRYLKPLKCLAEPSLTLNPLMTYALKDLFSSQGFLASIRDCLDSLYYNQTATDEHVQSLDLARRLAGYFYDKQIVEFLNTTYTHVLATIDTSSAGTRMAFLRTLQLQGELFLMLQPTTLNCDDRLPDSDLFRDIRHGLSHISRSKLQSIVFDEELLKSVAADLQELGKIFGDLQTGYPSFGAPNNWNIQQFWLSIKTASNDLTPRSQAYLWEGFEGLRTQLSVKPQVPESSLIGANFDEDIDAFMPELALSESLQSFLQLKKQVWDALGNVKDQKSTLDGLVSAFKTVDSNRCEQFKENLQQKALELAEFYKEQLKSLRDQQRTAQKTQQQTLDQFTSACETERKTLEKNAKEIYSKKIREIFQKSDDAKGFAEKFRELVGIDGESNDASFEQQCKAFYFEYQKLQEEFDQLKSQIDSNPEVSDVRSQATDGLLELWFEEEIENLNPQAKAYEDRLAQRNQLRKHMKETHQNHYFRGGKLISSYFEEFIHALQGMGLEVEECVFNWEEEPTDLERLFCKVYRIHIGAHPVQSLEDKRTFRRQKALPMLGILDELRGLLPISTTIALEADKKPIQDHISQKSSLMSNLTKTLNQLNQSKNSLIRLHTQLKGGKGKHDDSIKLQQLAANAKREYHAILGFLPENAKPLWEEQTLEWSTLLSGSAPDYKEKLLKSFDQCLKILEPWTEKFTQIQGLNEKFSLLHDQIYQVQSTTDLQALQTKADQYFKAYIEAAPAFLKEPPVFQDLNNTTRGAKRAEILKRIMFQQVQTNPRFHIQDVFLKNLKDRWRQHLTPDFYGCEYLIACFYEMFKPISDFPELSGFGNSRLIRNKLFHFDPFKSDPSPFSAFSEGLVPLDHETFVAKEAIILSINMKYLLEQVGVATPFVSKFAVFLPKP